MYQYYPYSSSLTSAGTRQVGILGHQTREAALACLQNCPLVADLADWSHWSLVFEPELGPLKEFVQKYGRVHSATVTGRLFLELSVKISVSLEVMFLLCYNSLPCGTEC